MTKTSYDDVYTSSYDNGYGYSYQSTSEDKGFVISNAQDTNVQGQVTYTSDTTFGSTTFHAVGDYSHHENSGYNTNGDYHFADQARQQLREDANNDTYQYFLNTQIQSTGNNMHYEQNGKYMLDINGVTYTDQYHYDSNSQTYSIDTYYTADGTNFHFQHSQHASDGGVLAA